MTRKITVEKSEGVAELIDRILEEPAKDITLIIPKGSLLGRSVRNFTLLKREMDSAGRSLAIESVDDSILAFAKGSGFETTHSLWKSQGAQGISDILPAVQARNIAEDEEEERPTAKRKGTIIRPKIAKAPEVKPEEPEDEDVITEKEDEEQEEDVREVKRDRFFAGGADRFFKERSAADIEEAEEEEERSRFSWKWLGVCLVILAIVGATLYIVTTVFGRVEIAINFKQTPWQYQGSFTADKSASKIDATNDILPAQLFTISKNTTQLFPASGQQNVSIKAQGTLTIYNAYSSAAQTLVATTRFTTPDGKIFRLVNEVVVPGAQVTNGQIVPSSINAQIVADQAGPSYNVGPVAKLTVPGFANSPKEQGFYGSIASGTTGGFTGEKAVPTAADIANAKTKMTSILQSDLQGGFSGSYPNNFKILDGATNIQISKLSINTTTDQNGNFSVFGEAVLQAIGFDETAFKAFLLQNAQSTESSSTFSSLTLNYGSSTPDFTNGRLSFSLSAQGTLEPAFSPSDFEDQISGDSITQARAAIAGLPQLADGSISVWPSWLWDIPSNHSKIDINVK